MPERVNYNQISKVYNSRYEQNPLTGVQTYLTNYVISNSPKDILEVGCGTCHWLSILADNDSKLFGADLSIGMLRKARTSSQKLRLINSDADRLPLKENSFDFIYVVNAIHHFPKPLNFIKQVRNLLKYKGSLCIIGIEISESINDWYIYQYFKRAIEIDLKRFPSFKDLSNEMRNNSFTNISRTLAEQVNAVRNGNDILHDHFLNKQGASQLALLSDEEYLAGINQIERDIKAAHNEKREITFQTKLNFYSLVGTKE